MKKTFAFNLMLALVLMFSLQGHAELYVRGTDNLGNQLIYDDDLNITWYDYTNAVETWYYHNSWAYTLSVNFSGTIYDDWRLPVCTNMYSTGSGDPSCIESEISHLYYTELGNSGLAGLTNTGDFQNLISSLYWMDGGVPNRPSYALWTSTNNGASRFSLKDAWRTGIAVRTGDVAVVPEPISFILFIAGGSLLAGRRYIKRKKHNQLMDGERVPAVSICF